VLSGDTRAPVNQELTKYFKTYELSLAILVLPPDFMKYMTRLAHYLGQKPASLPLVAAFETGDADEVSSLFELGAADFITAPLTPLNTLPRLRRLLEHSGQRQASVNVLTEKLGLKQLLGESQVFRKVIEKIPLIARSDASVLLSGETGTGKELCARAIHYLSPRQHGAFVPVNCGAFPAELMENELFGHERGAFTTAFSSKTGLIGEADGGTLFLDEIDSLSLVAQVKLLRFLQEKEYRSLGSVKTLRSDCRVIAAANIDFAAAVKAGTLRQDLYYRLNVIPLQMPPLRERREDIRLLALHFVEKCGAESHRQKLTLSPDALQHLMRHDWPGNVRELEHVIARAVALSQGDVIGCSELGLDPSRSDEQPLSFREAKVRFERGYVEELLMAHGGNISHAAREADKNRRAFWELIRKYNIDAGRFRLEAKSNSSSRT
jgi:DNA-binding NtrC family response regulator